MSPIASRPYESATDLRLMADVLRAARPEAWREDYPTLSDLQESMLIPAVRANCRLWFDGDGAPLAFAFVDAYHNLVFESRSAVDSAILDGEIVEWGVNRLCASQGPNADEDGPLTLDASSREDDARRLAFLRAHGFRELPERTLTMTRDLSEPIPAAEMPPGYRIRASTGEAEVEAWVALHRAAFGTEYMTVDERLAMIQVAGFDPALDLVAEADSGDLAAYCCCAIEPREDGPIVGTTDPVATHPRHQGRGLARALLLTGMHLLKERGADVVRLGTSSDNRAMQRAAESAGFRVTAARLWFAKAVGD